MNDTATEPGIAAFEPQKIKVVVFDVDDTITRGTQEIKNNTWDKLFSDKSNLLQEARELYEYTGRGNRYNMIAHIIGEPQDGCEKNLKVTKWADVFETNIQTKIWETGIHGDDLAVLIKLSRLFSGHMYLLSTTPQKYLDENMTYFMRKYPEIEGIFSEIIGSPFKSDKAGELKKIALNTGREPYEILMVGDGGSDYNGAFDASTQFIGVVQKGNEKWSDEKFPKITSIAELPDILHL